MVEKLMVGVDLVLVCSTEVLQLALELLDAVFANLIVINAKGNELYKVIKTCVGNVQRHGAPMEVSLMQPCSFIARKLYKGLLTFKLQFTKCGHLFYGQNKTNSSDRKRMRWIPKPK